MPQAKAVEFQLTMMGKPKAAILDYLDTTSQPSVNGFFAYMDEEEWCYNAQVRWDTIQQKAPIVGGKSLNGSGQFAAMDKLPRRS